MSGAVTIWSEKKRQSEAMSLPPCVTAWLRERTRGAISGRRFGRPHLLIITANARRPERNVENESVMAVRDLGEVSTRVEATFCFISQVEKQRRDP